MVEKMPVIWERGRGCLVGFASVIELSSYIGLCILNSSHNLFANCIYIIYLSMLSGNMSFLCDTGAVIKVIIH